MRMDRSLKISAYDIVNSFAQNELEKIIRFYGEEKMAARIARAISQKRQLSPIETTTELAAIVASCHAREIKMAKNSSRHKNLSSHKNCRQQRVG